MFVLSCHDSRYREIYDLCPDSTALWISIAKSWLNYSPPKV